MDKPLLSVMTKTIITIGRGSSNTVGWCGRDLSARICNLKAIKAMLQN